MNCEEIIQTDEFKSCVEFHGHFCPGLTIGYRAALAALDYFKEERSVDEELVAIVETDACGVDAIQALTGCTFGKGNLIYKDYGKQVFYFIARETGKAVRIAMKPNAIKPTKADGELLQKAKDGRASEEELERIKGFRKEKACAILEAPVDEIFTVKEVEIPVPPEAQVASSEPCELCGEPTMSTKLESVAGKKICRECMGEN